MNNVNKDIYHVTLMNKFRKLYAVISPEQCIVMRTFDREEANLITFLLNNKTDITFALSELVHEKRIHTYEQACRIEKSYNSLKEKDKPW